MTANSATADTAAPARPAVDVAVVMERETAPNQWEDWRHRLIDVVADQPAFGTEPKCLRDDGRLARTIYPGFRLELFADEGEGYYLNLSSGNPVWFVMWRVDDADPSNARPEAVSLSYNEAGRWLDAQERVDNVPLQPELIGWLQAYTDAHYRPEPRKRKRPVSFLAPGERPTS
ncbi:DUF3305 domain-containing protein [Piscinibacter sakaiensis]|uniref:DUF3305 domain-containing protein n=1 Tax=Piscinibacter sakaiensis TaxID=1547922 RepID=UPI003AABB476